MGVSFSGIFFCLIYFPSWLLPLKVKLVILSWTLFPGRRGGEDPWSHHCGFQQSHALPGTAHGSTAGTQQWHRQRTSAVRGILKNAIRLNLEKNINTEGVNWKPAGWESCCTVVGMQQPQGPLNDWWHTRDIVKLPFLLVLESYVLKDYSWEEVKRILIFGLDINLR